MSLIQSLDTLNFVNSTLTKKINIVINYRVYTKSKSDIIHSNTITLYGSESYPITLKNIIKVFAAIQNEIDNAGIKHGFGKSYYYCMKKIGSSEKSEIYILKFKNIK